MREYRLEPVAAQLSPSGVGSPKPPVEAAAAPTEEKRAPKAAANKAKEGKLQDS